MVAMGYGMVVVTERNVGAANTDELAACRMTNRGDWASRRAAQSAEAAVVVVVS